MGEQLRNPRICKQEADIMIYCFKLALEFQFFSCMDHECAVL